MESFGMTNIIQITHHRDDQQLSEEFKIIIRNHPNALDGLLKEHQQIYEEQLSEDINHTLENSEVPLMNEKTAQLCETWLPAAKMTSEVETYGVESFPFLDLSHASRDVDSSSWRFLDNFGVVTTNNGRF